MRDTDPKMAALSADDRRRVESWLLAFDQSWHEGRLQESIVELPPPGNPVRLPALTEAVKIDLDRQWQGGRQRTVEDYLRELPELGSRDTVAPDVIRAEYLARQDAGDTADLGQFAARFPKQAEQLRLLVQGAVQAAGARSSRATPAPVGKPLDKPVQLPERFGRYKIVRRLGHGGMGAVFLAHDTELHRDVALKVPHLAADNQEIVERFYREARAAAGLSHPNICSIHDVGQSEGRLYLTMAYVEGKPLSAFIQPGKPIAPVQAAQLTRKIALALEEAHRKGIIHRDLKPANIMINLRKEPVIMDFGLAKRAGSEDIRLTKSGAVVGTPAYMSPEQVGGQDAGPASDIYSLGVILYELLTGKIPFDGPAMAVLGAILTQEPARPSQHRADLDPQLEAACLKALAKKPADRYGSMAEFAAALGKYVSAAAGKAKETPAKDADTFAFPGGDRTQSPAGRPSRPAAKPAAAAASPAAPSPAAPRAAQPAPARTRKWLWIAAVVVSACVVMMLAAVVILLATPNGTVKIEVDDPNIQVAIDGKTIRIEDAAMPLAVGAHNLALKLGNQSLTIGKTVRVQNEEKKLTVSFGDYELRGDTFTIVRGENPVMKISLVPTQPVAGADEKKRQQSADPGWQPLFNGEDLTGWVVDSGDPKTWRVENGELAFTANPAARGWLMSDRDYADFVLRFEFQISARANSGVAFRAAPGAKNAEIQILDDASAPAEKPIMRTGALWRVALDQPAVLRPAGAWNQMEIEAQGRRLRVTVNGSKTLDANLDTLAAPGDLLPSLKRSSGRIGFQQWDGTGRFRNIQVQRVVPAAISASVDAAGAGWTRLFNGKDLTGWQSPPEQKGDWRVESGVLVGRGPQLSHLFTERDDFTDFHFLVEARINAKGNSGQVFRVPQIKSGHPGGYEAQIDSGSHGNKTGSLYVMPKQNGSFIKNVLVPPDTWFTQEVMAQGNRIIIKVNDKVVTDFVDANRTYLRGHLALQVWDPPTVVEFRRVEVKELKAAVTPGAGWVVLNPAGAASWSWGNPLVGPDHKSYATGILTLDNGAVSFPGATAKDSILRAKVQFGRGQNVGLSLREQPQGGGNYYAYCYRHADGYGFFNLGISERGGAFRDLQTVRRDNFPSGFFDMEFAAIGDLLTVRVNGEKLIEVRDRTYAAGPCGLNAFNARGMFKDVEFKALAP